MAVAAKLYGRALQHFTQGDIAYLTDDIKVMLLGSGYGFDQDAHEDYADVVSQEVAAGNGYVAGGVALNSKDVTYDAVTNRTHLWADNTFWTPATGESLTASYAIIYKDSGTDGTSWLIGYVDFGTSVTATGAPLTINWDTVDGLLYIEVA